MTTINITALRHSAFYTPLLLTIANDLLEQEGLKPNYQPATPGQSVTEGLLNGDYHLAQSAVATSFTDLEQGRESELVHFARINSRDGFFIAAREPIKDFTWQDLKGREVLVDHFFQPRAMLGFALYRQGMSLNDLQVIDAGDVAGIEQAFRAGQGDFVHLQGPAPQQLEYEGLAHVVASVGEAVGPVAFSSLCARHDWLKTDMARTFMRAYVKALDYSINAPASEIAKAEQSAGFFTDIDSKVLASTIEAYQKLETWQTDPAIGQGEYENLLDVFSYAGHITSRYAYDRVIVSPPESETD